MLEPSEAATYEAASRPSEGAAQVFIASLIRLQAIQG